MVDKVEEALQKEGIEKEITCERAFALAEKYHIPKIEISRYCNQHKIKIRSCQLGCFR
jgi:hypothetical protein